LNKNCVTFDLVTLLVLTYDPADDDEATSSLRVDLQFGWRGRHVLSVFELGIVAARRLRCCRRN